MKKIIFFALIAVVSFSCASKRYAKKAMKYEEAGLYEDAALMYYESLKAKQDNIDAKLGLRKTGQMVLDKKLSEFSEAYHLNSDKIAVYAYLEAKRFYDMVLLVGVGLSFDEGNTAYYNEIKNRYLSSVYANGSKALSLEEFDKAKQIFGEIISIDPTFQNAGEMYKTAKFEPMYRSGITQLDNGLFRSAYYTFVEILKENNAYKDVAELKEEALEKAKISIAVLPVSSKYRNEYDIFTAIRNGIIAGIDKVNSPFYEVMSNSLTDEKLLNFSPKVLQNTPEVLDVSEYRALLGVKAVFIAQITLLDIHRGNLDKNEKKGFVKYYVNVQKDSVTVVKEARYKKVNYYEFKQENSLSLRIEFKLISTENKSVLLADNFYKELSKQVHYADFNGDKEHLVPGHWERKNRNSSNDRPSTSSLEINELKRLLKAERNLPSIYFLINDAVDGVSKKVTKKIQTYNPEK